MGFKYQLVPKVTIWYQALKSLARPEKLGFISQDIVLQMCHARIQSTKQYLYNFDTAMLSRMDSMEIHCAHDLLGGAYAMYMCGGYCFQCSALMV